MKTSKTKLLFYSDCCMFGGSEKVLFQLLTSPKIRDAFAIKFVYRRHRSYEEGVRKYADADLPRRGIRFGDPNTLNLNPAIPYPIKRILRVIGPVFAVHMLITLYVIIKRTRPALLYINNGGYPAALSCRIAAWAGRLAGVPTILMAINNMAQLQPEPNPLKRWLDQKVKDSVDVFVTGSKAAKKALAARGFDADRIKQIYHGFPGWGKTMPGGHADNGQRYFCMIANFEERKGHRVLVEAMSLIGPDKLAELDIKAYLVGDGPDRPAIERLVDEAGLSRFFQFFGHREDFLDILADSLFLVNPSIGFEDLPLVIIQAMALGKAVIGTDVAGIPEEIDNEKTGFVVPPDDAPALSKAILAMMDYNTRERLGGKAKARFAKMFALETMVSNYLTLLEKLVSNRRAA